MPGIELGYVPFSGRNVFGPAARGMGIFDFILRILAIAATLGSAIAMATTSQSLPFFTRFLRFKARYRDFPAFIFFVAANGTVVIYLLLSLVLSIFHIIRSTALYSRVILIFLDAATASLLTAGASAAAEVVYLAHKGNPKSNWFPICQPYSDFCQRASGSLVGSFAGVLILLFLVLMSAAALSRR